MAGSDFWNNRERAQADVEEVSRLKSLINPVRELEREIADFEALRTIGRGRENNAPARARRNASLAGARTSGAKTRGVRATAISFR